MVFRQSMCCIVAGCLCQQHIFQICIQSRHLRFVSLVKRSFHTNYMVNIVTRKKTFYRQNFCFIFCVDCLVWSVDFRRKTSKQVKNVFHIFTKKKKTSRVENTLSIKPFAWQANIRFVSPLSRPSSSCATVRIFSVVWFFLFNISHCISFSIDILSHSQLDSLHLFWKNEKKTIFSLILGLKISVVGTQCLRSYSAQQHKMFGFELSRRKKICCVCRWWFFEPREKERKRERS